MSTQSQRETRYSVWLAALAMAVVCVCENRGDAATVGDQSGGHVLWTNIYNGPGNGGDMARALAVGMDGNVFVTGDSEGDYATIGYASDGTPLWINHYSGEGNGFDYPVAIAVDGAGRVIVTGVSENGNNSSADYVTISYSSAGVPLWTNRYDGLANNEDWAWAIAVNSNGIVFVTGHTRGTNLLDYATISYSAAGLPLWTNYYNKPGTANDSAHALAVDRNGNVFVTGFSGNDYATVGYSATGVPLWTNWYDGNGVDEAYALAVDGNGNVFVTGAAGRMPADYATVAYSNSGLPLWTNRYDAGNDSAASIAVGRSGHIFVTGSSEGDYATVAYSNGGVPLWTNRYNGPGNGWDNATAITVDSSGNVVVTGSSISADGFNEYATVCYSDSGVPLWTNRVGSAGGAATAIAADQNGNVFVTGYLSSGGAWDFGTIKYFSGMRPRLSVALTGAEMILSWPSGFTDFLLQESLSVQSPSWSDVMEPLLDNGVSKSVSVPAGPGNRFFRLAGDQ